MPSPTRVLLVLTTASIRWKIARTAPPLLSAKLGRYAVVNPILNAELAGQSSRLDYGRPGGVFLGSNDEPVFSSQDIGLAVPPDAPEDIDFNALDADVSAFLIWLRSLSFQEQIPSTPHLVAVEDQSVQTLDLPAFPNPSTAARAFGRKYSIECCANESLAEEAARHVSAQEQVPVHHHMLVDAFSAFRSHDYRQCLLYAAIAAEALAAGRLEQEYAARLIGKSEPGPELRVIGLPVAGGKTARKDPVYELLSAKTDFSALLHQRPLYLMGRSLLVDAPETYRRATMLYATRNKIAHRGELSEDDTTQCFSMTSEDAWLALCCVADIFGWFGERPVLFPDNSLTELRAVAWGTRSLQP